MIIVLIQLFCAESSKFFARSHQKSFSTSPTSTSCPPLPIVIKKFQRSHSKALVKVLNHIFLLMRVCVWGGGWSFPFHIFHDQSLPSLKSSNVKAERMLRSSSDRENFLSESEYQMTKPILILRLMTFNFR